MGHTPSAALKALNSRHKKRRPRTSFFVELVEPGGFKINNNLLLFKCLFIFYYKCAPEVPHAIVFDGRSFRELNWRPE